MCLAAALQAGPASAVTTSGLPNQPLAPKGNWLSCWHTGILKGPPPHVWLMSAVARVLSSPPFCLEGILLNSCVKFDIMNDPLLRRRWWAVSLPRGGSAIRAKGPSVPVFVSVSVVSVGPAQHVRMAVAGGVSCLRAHRQTRRHACSMSVCSSGPDRTGSTPAQARTHQLTAGCSIEPWDSLGRQGSLLSVSTCSS